MRKYINLKFLIERAACIESIEEFENSKLRKTEEILNYLSNDINYFNWFRWLFLRVSNQKQLYLFSEFIIEYYKDYIYRYLFISKDEFNISLYHIQKKLKERNNKNNPVLYLIRNLIYNYNINLTGYRALMRNTIYFFFCFLLHSEEIHKQINDLTNSLCYFSSFLYGKYRYRYKKFHKAFIEEAFRILKIDKKDLYF